MSETDNRARAATEARIDAAKSRFTAAAKAALAGDPQAPELAAVAYRDVMQALADLKSLNPHP